VESRAIHPRPEETGFSAHSDKFPVCQVIFRDAMQHGAFRELRVRLKFF